MANVPNEPLREAFLRSGLSQQEMARRLALWRTSSRANYPTRKTVPDGSTVARTLGLRPERSHGYPARRREHMWEATALRYADALNLDPHEIGL